MTTLISVRLGKDAWPDNRYYRFSSGKEQHAIHAANHDRWVVVVADNQRMLEKDPRYVADFGSQTAAEQHAQQIVADEARREEARQAYLAELTLIAETRQAEQRLAAAIAAKPTTLPLGGKDRKVKWVDLESFIYHGRTFQYVHGRLEGETVAAADSLQAATLAALPSSGEFEAIRESLILDRWTGEFSQSLLRDTGAWEWCSRHRAMVFLGDEGAYEIRVDMCQLEIRVTFRSRQELTELAKAAAFGQWFAGE